jgi:ribosome-binding factor A
VATQRQARVAREVIHAVSNLVETRVSDPRINLVTFTTAKISPDLKQIRIFYSALGDDDAKRRCAEGLERAKGYLRREVGRALRLRFTPTLQFERDDSAERADRISRLLTTDDGGEADDQ